MKNPLKLEELRGQQQGKKAGNGAVFPSADPLET
jgi:hypothetical protein